MKIRDMNICELYSMFKFNRMSLDSPGFDEEDVVKMELLDDELRRRLQKVQLELIDDVTSILK